MRILFCINSDQIVVEFTLCYRQEVSVVVQSFLKLVVRTMALVHHRLVTHFERNDNLGHNHGFVLVAFPNLLDLIEICRESFQNPTVRLAIRSVQSILNQVNDNIIGEWHIILHASCQVYRKLIIAFPSKSVFDHLIDVDVDKLVLLCNLESLRLSVGSWWAHENDTLRPSWRFSTLKLEDSYDFL